MSIKLHFKRGKTLLGAPLALAAAVGSVAQAAEVKIPDTTIAASLRTSFVYTDFDTSGSTADFALNSLSVYLNSKLTDKIKFSLSTEIDAANDIQVQDAIAQFEFSPEFNIWAGRFLPPTDRANSTGSYFASHWNFATDGVQDGYEFVAFGRADGVAYWGDFADTKLKLSAGLFDIPRTTGQNEVMTAARVQYNFWDAEPGYYLSSTYYGDKDILSLGLATNVVEGKSTTSLDFLMEKKVGDGGAFTLEAEYIKYDDLGGYNSNFASGDGYFVLGAYLLPTPVGPGKLQFLGKFGTATFEDGNTPDYEQDTAEFNLNYIVKSYNCRLSLFVKDTSFSAAGVAAGKEDNTQIGLGLQLMTL
ncbi:MAG: hypothetical protein Q8J78_09945 [Moraxellaceae bacterium]|nr:hypothetical protein [Moraxellaceae bacterium]